MAIHELQERTGAIYNYLKIYLTVNVEEHKGNSESPKWHTAIDER